MNLKMQKYFLRTLAAIALAANSFAFAQSTGDSTANFSSFQIISQRNIFDPNRYPRRSNYRPRANRNNGAPIFSLAGTMSYRKGMFAFFSGNNSDYEKALQVGGTIAGYTVTKIDLKGVELKSGETNVIEMRVGAAMQQSGDGWQLVESGDWTQSSTSASEMETSNPSATETPASPSPDAGGNDVLKRLMQQRKQELK